MKNWTWEFKEDEGKAKTSKLEGSDMNIVPSSLTGMICSQFNREAPH